MLPRGAPPFVRSVARAPPPDAPDAPPGLAPIPEGGGTGRLSLLVRLSAAAHINGAPAGKPLRPIDARPAAHTPQARTWVSLRRAGTPGRLWPRTVRFPRGAVPPGSLMQLSFATGAGGAEGGGGGGGGDGSNATFELSLHGALLDARSGLRFELPAGVGVVRPILPPPAPPPWPVREEGEDEEYGEESYAADAKAEGGDWAAARGGVGGDDDEHDDDDDGEDDDGDDDDDADGGGGCSADAQCGCAEGAAARRGVINCTPLGRCKKHPAAGRGTCECHKGFAGEDCSACAAGYVGLPPQCVVEKECKLFCVHGKCDRTTGLCLCPAQFSGPQCEQCAPGYGGLGCMPIARVDDAGWQPVGARTVAASSVLPQARRAPPSPPVACLHHGLSPRAPSPQPPHPSAVPMSLAARSLPRAAAELELAAAAPAAAGAAAPHRCQGGSAASSQQPAAPFHLPRRLATAPRAALRLLRRGGGHFHVAAPPQRPRTRAGQHAVRGHHRRDARHRRVP